MTDWSALRTAYGPADQVPALLAAARGGDDAAWNDLWGHLCHQGTVYTASYAALPALADLAEQSPPAPYVQPLHLAAMILASDDRADAGANLEPTTEHAETLARLHVVAERNLALARDASDLVYAAQCVVALERVPHWATQLDRLADWQTDAVCPACEQHFYVDIDKEAAPADPDSLDAGSSRTYGLLTQREDVAEAFLKLAGTATCPHCGSTVSLYPAVAPP